MMIKAANLGSAHSLFACASGANSVHYQALVASTPVLHQVIFIPIVCRCHPFYTVIILRENTLGHLIPIGSIKQTAHKPDPFCALNKWRARNIAETG